MKKRLSFLPTVIIGLTVVFFLGAILVWGLEKFNLPDWITPVWSMVTMFSFFEVVGRLGPGEFEPMSIRFMKVSLKDRIVLVVAFLMFLILTFPIGTSFNSRWLNLLFFSIGFLVFWFICYFFGSKDLLARVPKDKSHEQHQ